MEMKLLLLLGLLSGIAGRKFAKSVLPKEAFLLQDSKEQLKDANGTKEFVKVPGKGYCWGANNDEDTSRRIIHVSCDGARALCQRDCNCVAYACLPTKPGAVLYTDSNCELGCRNIAWLLNPDLITKAGFNELNNWFADGDCYKLACSAGHKVGGNAINTCTPVACPQNSAGEDVPSGCTCYAGYSGTITASFSNRGYTGECTAVACPKHSTGANVQSGCYCNEGYSGTIIASSYYPFYSGSCTCTNTSSALLAACSAGYAVGGNSTCTPVACPRNSAGENVPSGCTCYEGYSGTITASFSDRGYTGECTAVACPKHSTGANVQSGCYCTEGYSGTIIAISNHPFYSGSCTLTNASSASNAD
eukprot:CAMPEP_0197703856 /NCGR_PEP_ID=MMETSP1338-20131121/125648_1 /TAXON_ID=43686 ORGANISM="Pelagodinium beii, Strain RCC1491" /NCGR_SAMPLE_ID=MMETSP1338 /ASSEMBLY_ACC=CAM_ASM_000754 /LENGTH=361 /DNA_ID=CAMNT_0043287755 /DNA_START=32 /DNA_END=1117 /DNA_ORIENTATION=-